MSLLYTNLNDDLPTINSFSLYVPKFCKAFLNLIFHDNLVGGFAISSCIPGILYRSRNSTEQALYVVYVHY
jgi:hypothetical protein